MNHPRFKSLSERLEELRHKAEQGGNHINSVCKRALQACQRAERELDVPRVSPIFYLNLFYLKKAATFVKQKTASGHEKARIH